MVVEVEMEQETGGHPENQSKRRGLEKQQRTD